MPQAQVGRTTACGPHALVEAAWTRLQTHSQQVLEGDGTGWTTGPGAFAVSVSSLHILKKHVPASAPDTQGSLGVPLGPGPPLHSSSEALVSSIPIPPTTTTRLPQRRMCGKRDGTSSGEGKRTVRPNVEMLTSCLSRVRLSIFGDQLKDQAQAHESCGPEPCAVLRNILNELERNLPAAPQSTELDVDLTLNRSGELCIESTLLTTEWRSELAAHGPEEPKII